MLNICLRFAPKVQFQDDRAWKDHIITSPVEHMHDTPATGQRDVRQHENTERMASQIVDSPVLVDVFEDIHAKNGRINVSGRINDDDRFEV